MTPAIFSPLFHDSLWTLKRGVVQMAHFWLSTLLTFWQVVRSCVNFCPRHKEFSLMMSESCTHLWVDRYEFSKQFGTIFTYIGSCLRTVNSRPLFLGYIYYQYCKAPSSTLKANHQACSFLFSSNLISPCHVTNVYGINSNRVLQLSTFIDNQEQW